MRGVESRSRHVPDATRSWWISQRGRGMQARTVPLPAAGRAFVPSVLVHTLATVGLNLALCLGADCMLLLELGLSALVAVFVAYFAIEAVRTENQYQLFAYLGLSTAFVPLYVVPLAGGGGALHTAAIAVAAAFYSINGGLALLTYRGAGDMAGFGWRVYKKVGADPVLVGCYRTYQQFCSTLKLDWLAQAHPSNIIHHPASQHTHTHLMAHTAPPPHSTTSTAHASHPLKHNTPPSLSPHTLTPHGTHCPTSLQHLHNAHLTPQT
ncbi:hypothetical protein AB1Y20_007782 [Prymnesium parvum]|uniref:Uncharacterized protein n=1 Tax=Prymnesium parvum TaxID=97485 RepID=A0AB34IUR9_PRYPA